MSKNIKLVVCNEPQSCGTVKELEAQRAIAITEARAFCREQCEEGPGWGECKESGCHTYFIKKALSSSSKEEAT